MGPGILRLAAALDALAWQTIRSTGVSVASSSTSLLA